MGDGRSEGRGQASQPNGLDRVTVPQAANRLGLSQDAIRKRVARGTIPHDKTEDGRVFVYVPEVETATKTDQDKDQDAGKPSSDTDALIAEMRAHNETLREQLEAERNAHAEARRLLLAALERIPAVEAPESTETPAAPDAGTQTPGASPTPEKGSYKEASFEVEDPPRPRPWWRRIFGA